jgi:hypothetical protein
LKRPRLHGGQRLWVDGDDRVEADALSAPKEVRVMRMMLKFQVPVDAGNDALRNGRFAKTMGELMERIQPEASYFHSDENGQRGGYVFFDLDDPSSIPSIAEPLFRELHVSLKFVPVMNMEDLQKALGGLQQ